jgi:glutamyl-tRNA synthetase
LVDAPRVRIAPSPTGFFHVGSARTALFNWLFARRHGGTFVVRIEDTDAERNREEWVDVIVDALNWLGLAPDEPPVRQSQFAAAHAEAATRLYESGALYGCDCTREAIDERLVHAPQTGYDGHCRDRGLTRGPGVALRFRVPDDGETIVHDVIRGDVVFQNASIEDFVVVRSNGAALFALSNLVDDRAMSITHVVRGEEHLANTPKQLLLAAALDAAEGVEPSPPVFAHVPLLVNEQRQKISKRRDPVAVELYRDQGFLAPAVLNFLALLGWSPGGDDEMIDLDTMIQRFALEDVNHSPAFFDVAKLTHLNGAYIRALDTASFVEACQPWVAPRPGEWRPTDHVPPWSAERFDPTVFASIAPLVQERVATLGEVPGMVDFLFLDEPVIDPADFAKAIARQPHAAELLNDVLKEFEACPFDAESLHRTLVEVGERHDLALRKAQAPVRVAVTGRSIGPPLFESMALLGRDTVRRRLAAAAKAAGGVAAPAPG